MIDFDAAVKRFVERYAAHQTEMAEMGKTAKQCGLSRVQYQLLKALADRQPASYRDIVERTGLYSNLPDELLSRHHDSLGAKGLIREGIELIGDEKVSTFEIKARGWKLLGKPVERGPVKHFEQRYLDWEARLAHARKLGKRVGLSGYHYLILEALGDGELATFADIARRTSICSGLPQLARSRHAEKRSLGGKGLVREDIFIIDNKRVFACSITREGKKRLDRAAEK
jgi:DNA-binding MarR family transcriptional regulator